MRILKNYKLDETACEIFKLNNIYRPIIPVGVLICYLFANNKNVDFLHFTGTSPSEEIHSGFNLVGIEKGHDGRIKNLGKLYSIFKYNDLYEWMLKIKYDEFEYRITGCADDVIVKILSSFDINNKRYVLIRAVEEESWNYHPYDDKIVEKVKNYFQLNQRIAVECMDKLKKNQDDYKNFLLKSQNNSNEMFEILKQYL